VNPQGTPTNPARRDFLITGSLMAIAVLLDLRAPAAGASALRNAPFRPGPWLALAADGTAILAVAQTEMGQRVHTALCRLVAEELDVAPESVRTVQAPLNPVYGYQITSGSRSIRRAWMPLREAAARARQMLVAAAAAAWGVPPGRCRTHAGRVMDSAGGRALAYADLAARAARQPVPARAELKPPGRREIIGRPRPDPRLQAMVTGKALYCADIPVAGSLAATVLQPPAEGLVPAHRDETAALAVPGVRRVLRLGDTLAVVADHTGAALAGADALRPRWKGTPRYRGASADDLLRRALSAGTVTVIERGSPRASLQGGGALAAEYWLPLQAHAPLEPTSCSVARRDGIWHVWVPTQSPSAARNAAAGETLGEPARLLDRVLRRAGMRGLGRVRIHAIPAGGAFGRRLEQDQLIQALRIARRIERPVRLTWSRAEDFRHDFYRPASMHRLRARLDADGRLAAWEHELACASIDARVSPEDVRGGIDGAAVSGAHDLPYAPPHFRVGYALAESPVPVGFWRSVGYSHNVFATECFADELACAAGVDPVRWRLDALPDRPRLRAVLARAADYAGWPGPRRTGEGMGVAVNRSHGSFVATVAQVSAGRARGLRVERVVCVIDCGTVVDPDGVRAQMEGSIAWALSATLGGAITVRDGAVEQTAFSDFPLVTMGDMPELSVLLAPSGVAPGGAGEPGVPPVAPAVANAVYAATGERRRRLPLAGRGERRVRPDGATARRVEWKSSSGGL